MKRILSLLLVWTLGASFAVFAQSTPTTDVLGAHDLSSGANPMHGTNANACAYCHVPHHSVAAQTPLWNQTLSSATYTFYSSPTEQNIATQPTLGKTSQLCLSCHDGTVAVGQTVAYGTWKMSSNTFGSVLGTALEGSHPFSLQTPLKDSPSLVSTLASNGTTKDPAVQLINGNVECNSCHDVHNQYIDRKSLEFLVRDGASGALCLACHDTAARTVNGRTNSLTAWTGSIHNTSTNQVATKAGLGNYTTVSEFACSNCHAQHNATGPGLLVKSVSRPPNVDDTSQACFTCHDGSDNLSTPLMNVLADFQKKDAHPFTDSSNLHTINEPVQLDNNRHTTCADCHNSHAAVPTGSFTTTAALRGSQTGVNGMAMNGTVLTPAANQYESCLRCHGASTGTRKAIDYGIMPARLFPGNVYNVVQEFSTTALSAHPVMRDATNINQPSLLSSMWDITGKVQTRAMGSRILCTDCHNNDNNREFGGTGTDTANGPHGSKYDHILERQYVISTVNGGTFPTGGPGSPIINTTVNPPLDPVSSPYALCAKCHDLTNIVSNASFFDHSGHINTAGVSCSVCHSAHGVPSGTADVTGARLVSFDRRVVAPYKGTVSYDSKGNCTLICHMWDHNGSAKPKPH